MSGKDPSWLGPCLFFFRVLIMITVIKISIARRIDGKMYLKNFNSALFNLGALSFFQVGKLRGSTVHRSCKFDMKNDSVKFANGPPLGSLPCN
jgi:hypothetical protein